MLEAEATARAKVGTCEPLERGRQWEGAPSSAPVVTLHFSICWGSAAPLPLLEPRSCSYEAVTLLALG